MAVTSIWPIKGRVDDVILYAIDPAKTIESNPEMTARLHAIEDVIEYAQDEMKTEQHLYVSGINCNRSNAAEWFKHDLQRYKNEGDRVCYHAYQSFAAGEVDAHTANKVGKKLAENLWGSTYRVLIATHCNTGHFHNHYIICAAPMLDGRKFRNSHEDYQKMREESDRLCREYGLSVIEEPQGRGKNYGEWLAEKEGRPTLRGTIREAIDEAIRASVNINQFLDYLDEMGFIIDQSGKYAKIKHVGNERFVRFRSLGDGYSIDDIYKRIARNKHGVIPEIPDQESPQQIFDEETRKPENMDYIDVNRCYCRALNVTKERPKTNLRMYYLVRQDHSALRLYQDQLHLVTEHKLKGEADVKAYKVKAMNDIDAIYGLRKEFRNELRKAERFGEPDRSEMTRKITFYINECSKQLSKLRREVTTCGEVLEHIDRMRENLMRIEQEKFNGEEVLTYEPISGRGGSDRQSELERH